MALRRATPAPRNPGPSWGFQAVRAGARFLPRAVFSRLCAAGTGSAVLLMPRQRRHSRNYLRTVLGREPRLHDVYRHFLAVCDALVLRLRVADGLDHRCVLADGCAGFAEWLASDRPAFLGTFHIGNSDLTGFMLADQGRKRVHLVRLRVANSHDTDALAARFGDRLRFVWVNDPSEMLFALKEAGLGGDTIAMQCDRPDHSSRSEAFDFLGGRRRFPFTIYHLALIFNRPVILSFGAPTAPAQSTVVASPVFEPMEGEGRSAALARARAHFQAFLATVDAYLRSNPYQWLNFLPL
jgi:predicted LPLAT superfamily acyltransferase